MTYLPYAAGAIAIASIALTGLVRRWALRSNALDVPNARSSHVTPTPRGGGVAIVVTSLLAMGGFALFGHVDERLFFALAGGGIAVALVGHLDDRGRIGIAGRFVIHVAAALWATLWLGGMTDLHFGSEVFHLGYAGTALSVLGIVWALNLFNFMDGIDALAGSQAVFMGAGGAAIALLANLSLATPEVCLAIVAACLGFLWWNWPPARIFMGDVGSGYLGFVLAVVALGAVRERGIMLPVWLILGGVFAVDATVTLLRRLVRRERFYEAHRSHAYQWQARRWNSHRRVTLACAAINLLWLAPLACICVLHPRYAGWVLAAAWLSLAALAVACGAGRRET
jgi:Fuc2NAc and GlcNAc transferase